MFIWSDPHFGHKNVIKYCNRPFSSVEEMNEKLIENYNSVVGEDDDCIWVGDCFFTKKSEAKRIMSRLNGSKFLIRGNHDWSEMTMINIGFTNVTDNFWISRVDEYKIHHIQISHYPFKPSTFQHLKMNFMSRFMAKKIDMRYMERRPKDNGQFLIHGHTHQTKTFCGRSIHVGVDSNLYTPVNMNTIFNYIENYKK